MRQRAKAAYKKSTVVCTVLYVYSLIYVYYVYSTTGLNRIEAELTFLIDLHEKKIFQYKTTVQKFS